MAALHCDIDGVFDAQSEDNGTVILNDDDKRVKVPIETGLKHPQIDDIPNDDSVHQEVDAHTPFDHLQAAMEAGSTEVLAIQTEPANSTTVDSKPYPRQNLADTFTTVEKPDDHLLGFEDPPSDTKSVSTIPDNINDLCRRKRKRELDYLQDRDRQKRQRCNELFQYMNEEILSLVNQNLTVKLSRQDIEIIHLKMQLAAQNRNLTGLWAQRTTKSMVFEQVSALRKTRRMRLSLDWPRDAWELFPP